MSSPLEGALYCQVCGCRNSEELEYCRHCHQRLLVVSGPQAIEEQDTFDSNPEEQFSFDEHLLERISILEEVVKRTTETVRHALGALYKLEQQILVNQTGVTTLRDMLESKNLIAREEWSELWESRMDYQLLALEKRERFAGAKDKIAALYSGDEPERFHTLLDEAEYALSSLDIETAVRVLDRAHRSDLANHELSFFLGETFFNEGAGETALGYFAKVLAVKPSHFESLVFSGVLCHEQHEEGHAEELLKRALAHYPEAFLPAFSLGAVFAARGRLSEAAVLLERAVALDPIPQALYLLGNCCYEMGRSGAAIRHLREVVRMDPAFEEAYDLLGLAYLDRRWHRKAMTALGEAQRLHPKTLRYHELMQLLPREAAGDAPEPEPPTAGDTAGDNGLLGRDLSPDAVSQEALAFVRKAEAALAGGEPSQALSFFRQALAQETDNPTLLVAYAMACLEIGRTQEIESVIDKVIGLDPGEPLTATACATLIEALRFQGKYREGNRIGRKLLGDECSDFTKTVAYFELAFNLAEIEEDLDDALTYARSSVELAPREIRPFSLAALGWVHFKRREFPQAVDCLTQSSELEPSGRTLTHLGMALLAAGERDEARQALVQARDLGHAALGEKVLEALKDGTRRLRQTLP